MAIGPRLDLRQSQSLVMTPQLQQAIKLLALSNLEIETFIGDALENNPLLEAGEMRVADGEAPTEPEMRDATSAEGDGALDIDQSALDVDRDTGDWSAAPSGSGVAGEGFGLENRSDAAPTLADHLEEQIGACAPCAQTAFIARYVIGLLDEAGYLSADLRDIAVALDVPLSRVEAALDCVQSLDPTGVGARSLSECLALQAKEADRYDPCMEVLINNLELVAKGAFAHLKRICDVDDEDLADMLSELRSYDPKPGLAFGGGAASAVVPDVLLSEAVDAETGKSGWDIQLNEATLPRLVVNRGYYLELREGSTGKDAKAWLSEKLADANWLIKALDQRAKTILKVSAEIVKQQDGFFRKGVSELRPLTLAKVAEAIEMHESTVSRVTSNKFLHCERGTFELKYFFSSGVGSADGEGASAEAVKARIKALTDAEDPKKILSDDKLVELLKGEGFDLARRTVAKYREAIGIGSSVQRRRAKKLAGL
ncbi:RNA polymerase factor sigma-54 [Aurantiacibacter gangjinensis]|uniref:RNA polymerase sigma-54 factor n=1 Tax=Aurantiacibacter gangjinensis TaxID=502682 RepID=A0A0G9MLZ5_9SPHN|nr:RNA polymerase factor sigma-54 [Aurantiacibacter gangjinensis]APE27704.1 RNA polymerase sigma-54 factor RpoN [Aurantiacibacter gangjinensis]KLE31712.1 RNA polymerase sigma54 factor [Aurantiacibacter gangjinensis]